MKQELWQDYLRLPRLRKVAALLAPHTDNIQKPAKSPDYLLGDGIMYLAQSPTPTEYWLAGLMPVCIIKLNCDCM